MPQLLTWLHLSDIHFGQGTAPDVWDQRLVMSELKADIQTSIAKGYPKPDLVLLTGDVAFSGDGRTLAGETRPIEYESAARWLTELLGTLSLPPEKLFVIPGNHDVQRSVAQADRNVARLLDALRAGRDRLDTIFTFPADRDLLAQRQGNYLKFASAFGVKTQELFWSHQFKAGDLPVRLLGLNSALLCADDADSKRLEIGNQQLVRTLLSSPPDANELVIVLTHHPFDWLRDEASVRQTVERHAHLHLCGHVHEAQSLVRTTGGGSHLVQIVAGAVHDIAGPGSLPLRYGYSFGTIEEDAGGAMFVCVWPRVWSPKNRRFAVGVDDVPDGGRYAEHSLKLSRSRAAADSAQPPVSGAMRQVSELKFPADQVRVLREVAGGLLEAGQRQAAESMLLTALARAPHIDDERARMKEMLDLAVLLARVGFGDRARVVVSATSQASWEREDVRQELGRDLDSTVRELEHVAQAQSGQGGLGGPAAVVSDATPQSASAAESKPLAETSTVNAKPSPMPLVRRLRVFVSSPGDVGPEREQLRSVIAELNQTVAPPLGVVIELVAWETHTFPALGRPQQVITDQIGDYDIFLGIMWRRFGTPTGTAGSGTEEEFNDALRLWKATGRPQVMFYFSDAPAPPARDEAEIEQLKRVAVFRAAVQKLALTFPYTSARRFSDVVRPQLALMLQRFGPIAKASPAEKVDSGLRRAAEDLAKEYTLIRELMPSGDARTVRMEGVFVRMRELAPQVRPLMQQFQESDNAGLRLMAVAILQVFPECDHVEWLAGRFKRDGVGEFFTEMPFVGYHAAVALHEAGRTLRATCRERVRNAIRTSLAALEPKWGDTDRAVRLRQALGALDNEWVAPAGG